jgi:hypothetical protein
MLGSDSCASIIFLLRRIFPSLGAPSQAHAQPNGSVPGLARSGFAWRLLIVGEKLGFDRFSVVPFRVFDANLKDLDVILFSL